MKENNKKARLLFLVQLPPPVHGASMMNEYLVNSKRLKDIYDISVLNLDFVNKVSEIGKFTFGKLFQTFNLSITLISLLIKNKYDLVYFTLSPIGGAFYRDIIFVSILKIFRLKIAYHLHGKGISTEINHKFKKVLYRFVFKGTSVICLSRMLSYDISEVHVGPIYYVSNGIPDHHLGTLDIENINASEIVYLSNLVRSKGVLVLVDALSILRSQNVQFSAKIIGSATNDLTIDELKEIVVDKGLDEVVKVLGPIYGNNKFIEISSAAIFCFPTYYRNECFPLSILESMMVGLVPVSTNNGAIPEIIDHGINGMIVKMKDPVDLAEKLTQILNNPDKLQVMSIKAKQKFKELYTIEVFENNMIQTFKSMLGNKNF